MFSYVAKTFREPPALHDRSASINLQHRNLSAILMTPLLSGSLALSLAIDKGFGALLALALLVTFATVRWRDLRSLRRQDITFLALINGYPVVVLFSIAFHGLSDPALFDTASRFLLCSLLYIGLRVRPADMQWIVIGAAMGCLLALFACLHHLLQWTPEATVSKGRFIGTENAVVFALLAHSLLLVAVTPNSINALKLRDQRLLLGSVLVAIAIVQIISQSRMGLAAWLLLSIYVVLWDRRLAGDRVKITVLLITVAGLMTVLTNSSYFYHLGGTLSELSANIGQIDQSTSLGQRLALWSLSGELIAAHPLFGHGVGQFNAALNSLPNADTLMETVRGYGHAHSELLQITVEFGLMGLALVLLSLAGPAILAFIEGFTIEVRHLLLGTVLSWLFLGLVQSELAHQKTTLMLAFLLALGFSLGMNRKYGPLGGNRMPSSS